MRHYLRQTLTIERRKQLIVAVKVRRELAKVSSHFIWMLKKVESAGLLMKVVVADKGYDAERNHKYARESLGMGIVVRIRGAKWDRNRISQ